MRTKTKSKYKKKYKKIIPDADADQSMVIKFVEESKRGLEGAFLSVSSL